MTIETLYQDIILDHNRCPRNRKRLAGATHAARGQDASCGDDLLFELKVRDGRIVEAAFSGEACAVTQASASLLTLWLPGRCADEVRQGLDQFRALLHAPDDPPDPMLGPFSELAPVGRFPARRRNALLPWTTAVKAWGC